MDYKNGIGQSDSIINAAAIADKQNDITKRVHTSKGDTPGNPKNKALRLSRKKYPRSSWALFQSPGKSPKVKNRKKYSSATVQVKCKHVLLKLS